MNKIVFFITFIFCIFTDLSAQQNIYSREEMEKILGTLNTQYKEVEKLTQKYEKSLENTILLKKQVDILENRLKITEYSLAEEKKRLRKLQNSDSLRFDSLYREHIQLSKEHIKLKKDYTLLQEFYDNQSINEKKKLDSTVNVIKNVRNFMEESLTSVKIIATMKNKQTIILYEQNGRSNLSQPIIEKLKARKIKNLRLVFYGYLPDNKKVNEGDILNTNFEVFFSKKENPTLIMTSNLIGSYINKTMKADNLIDLKKSTIKKIRRGKYIVSSNYFGGFYDNKENKYDVINKISFELY